MPCFLETTVRFEKFKVRRDILPEALKAFVAEMEPVYGKVSVAMISNTVRISISGEVLIIDLAADGVSYSEAIKGFVNALKRHYSMAVVKHVGNRSRMKQHFTIRQTGKHELALQRRR